MGSRRSSLTATEDILEAVFRQKSGNPAKANRPCVTVGFAAESQALLENAGEKLKIQESGPDRGK